jgi:hypothetical protein
LASRKANAVTATAKSAARNANGAAASLLCTDPNDPSGSEEQGRRPGVPLCTPVENPEAHLAVVTKLAHEVLDLYALTPDVTEADVVAGIELRCRPAAYNIPTTRDVVHQAIAVAVYQRRRAGKTPVLAHSSGDSAFRLRARTG